MKPNSAEAWEAAKAPGAMPQTRAFVQMMRGALGDAEVDQILRAARAGQAIFYASENGITLGVPEVPRRCSTCGAWKRPGLSDGYCSGGRADLPLAYGKNHPLRHAPADGGVDCNHWRA